jgi:hypothetical protein
MGCYFIFNIGRWPRSSVFVTKGAICHHHLSRSHAGVSFSERYSRLREKADALLAATSGSN